LIDFYTLNLQANYYLNEQMAIGLRGTYTLNTETRAFNSVIQDYQLFPQVSRPIWSSSLNFQYTPLYGKFSLFQTWIFPWELSARGGVGWIQTFIDGHVLVTLGATQQFFLNRWLAFNIDLDYQLFQEVTSLESDEGTLLSNLVLGAGVSIYFPLDFEYKELK
jgi:outer membrane beta-barrel protein